MTQEERNALKQDIQRGLELGALNMHALGRKHNVDRKTVAYWRNKAVASARKRNYEEEGSKD